MLHWLFSPRTALLATFLVLVTPLHAHAQQSQLKIPRFVSLRSAEVNARTGPGSSYPIEWVFTRKALPVEVVQELDVWRRIRDIEGTEGWVHRSLLSGARTVQVVGAVRDIRRDPQPSAVVVARAEPGVIANLKRCQGDWCEISVGRYEGWLTRDEIWGVYPDETLE